MYLKMYKSDSIIINNTVVMVDKNNKLMCRKYLETKNRCMTCFQNKF